MSRPLNGIRADERGGAIVEFALVAPVLIVLIVGLLQLSTVFYAAAGVRSALSAGARQARLYRTPASARSWAGPSSTEICARVTSNIRAMANTTIGALTLTRSANGTANALTLALAYRVNLNFVFFNHSQALTATRLVFVGSQPDFGSPAVSCPV